MPYFTLTPAATAHTLIQLQVGDSMLFFPHTADLHTQQIRNFREQSNTPY